MILQIEQVNSSISWGSLKNQLIEDAKKITKLALPLLKLSMGCLANGFYYYTAAVAVFTVLMLPVSPIMPTLFINSLRNTFGGYAAGKVTTYLKIYLTKIEDL